MCITPVGRGRAACRDRGVSPGPVPDRLPELRPSALAKCRGWTGWHYGVVRRTACAA